MAEQPDLSKSGFAAISKKPPEGPLARKQLVRNPDGSVSLRYVDNATGLPLTSLEGYNLVEASNYMTLDILGLDPIKDDETKETTAEDIIKDTNKPFRRESDSSDPSASAGGNRSRTASDNFGYVNKPGWMGIAGAIPGPVGLAGKAVNLGLNVNNTAATNTARSMMGLPKAGFMSNLKGAFKDQKGYVADVKVGPTQYAVGLEAVDKYGRTTLTPQEAINRARAYNTTLSLATKPEVKSSIQEFKQEFPNANQGLFSKFGTAANKFIDNLFGGSSDNDRVSLPDYAPIPTARPSFAERSSGGTPSGVSLPDYAPVPTSRPSSGGSGGFSSQAAAAAASGGGGLY